MSSARRIWVRPNLSRRLLRRLGKSDGISGLAGTTILILCYMLIFLSHVELYMAVCIVYIL